jgi:hypothetical protein
LCRHHAHQPPEGLVITNAAAEFVAAAVAHLVAILIGCRVHAMLDVSTDALEQRCHQHGISPAVRPLRRSFRRSPDRQHPGAPHVQRTMGEVQAGDQSNGIVPKHLPRRLGDQRSHRGIEDLLRNAELETKQIQPSLQSRIGLATATRVRASSRVAGSAASTASGWLDPRWISRRLPNKPNAVVGIVDPAVPVVPRNRIRIVGDQWVQNPDWTRPLLRGVVDRCACVPVCQGDDRGRLNHGDWALCAGG